EAMEEVYWKRIQRGEQFFSNHTLGAVGADLAALSNFLDPSGHQPVDGLRDEFRGLVLNEMGIGLQSLGHVEEAAQLLEAGLTVRKAQGRWRLAAWSAENVYEFYLLRGNLSRARDFAQQSVDLAN